MPNMLFLDGRAVAGIVAWQILGMGIGQSLGFLERQPR